MNRLAFSDICVFALYLTALVGVGLYFTRQQKDLKTYLLANQDMSYLLVSLSVIAALFSGISFLGAPAETFHHNLTYMWTLASFMIATPVTALVFVPLFYRLNLYTAYEYLEQRFDRRLHLLASTLFLLRVSIWLSIAIYAPSLVLAEATGLPIVVSVLLTGTASTLYTALGGMKAVIWTDTLQFLVLVVGIVFIFGFAIIGVPGGLPAAWSLAAADGKTQFLDFRLDPTIRVTVWAALFGGAASNLVQMVTDQVSVQRYLTAKSLREAQRALWFKLGVSVPLVSLFYLTGTLLYGYYRVHGPMPSLAGPDRLLPYFVVHQLPSPMPGLLIAAILGATMSAVSAGLNSLTGVLMMDFGKSETISNNALVARERNSGRRQVRTARRITTCFGIFVTLMALFAGHLGTLVEAPVKTFGILGGPLLGVFFLAALTRCASGTGALIGVVAGGAITGALLWGTSVSFLWLAFAGAGSTFLIGLGASAFFPASLPPDFGISPKSSRRTAHPLSLIASLAEGTPLR